MLVFVCVCVCVGVRVCVYESAEGGEGYWFIRRNRQYIIIVKKKELSADRYLFKKNDDTK